MNTLMKCCTIFSWLNTGSVDYDFNYCKDLLKTRHTGATWLNSYLEVKKRKNSKILLRIKKQNGQ